MTMDIEKRKQIERYLDEGEAEFDRILAEGESKRRQKIIRWSAVIGAACAAAVALLLWLVPSRKAPENLMTPFQIAEGIQQLMLLDIGEVDSIEAIPKDSYAILTAHLKDGSSCSFILKCNEVEGTTTLLAYTDNN